MNMTRMQWLSQFFRPSFKPLKKKEPKPKPADPPRWLVMGRYYSAWSKSEARAMYKKATGERLPSGTNILGAW